MHMCMYVYIYEREDQRVQLSDWPGTELMVLRSLCRGTYTVHERVVGWSWDNGISANRGKFFGIRLRL